MKASTFWTVFCAALLLLFLGLKLADIGMVAAWSWWWVFAPVWVPIAMLVLAIVIGASVAICQNINRRRP